MLVTDLVLLRGIFICLFSSNFQVLCNAELDISLRSWPPITGHRRKGAEKRESAFDSKDG